MKIKLEDGQTTNLLDKNGTPLVSESGNGFSVLLNQSYMEAGEYQLEAPSLEGADIFIALWDTSACEIQIDGETVQSDNSTGYALCFWEGTID